MGTLKPGATYVYERVNDTVYAREVGSTVRSVIGYNYKPMPTFTHDQIQDTRLWSDIRLEAKTNPALQKALERAILIYRLSKDNPE